MHCQAGITYPRCSNTFRGACMYMSHPFTTSGTHWPRRLNGCGGVQTLGHVFDQPFERLHNHSNTVCLQYGYMHVQTFQRFSRCLNTWSHVWPTVRTPPQLFEHCLFTAWLRVQTFEQFSRHSNAWSRVWPTVWTPPQLFEHHLFTAWLHAFMLFI